MLDPPLRTIVETLEFQRRTRGLLTTDGLSALMDYVAANPNAGELMVGTGGAKRGAPESSGGRSKAAAKAEEYASLRLPVAPDCRCSCSPRSARAKRLISPRPSATNSGMCRCQGGPRVPRPIPGEIRVQVRIRPRRGQERGAGPPATGRSGARLPHGHRPGARGGAARALRHRRRKAPDAETHCSQAAGFCGKMMELGEDLKG